MSTTTLLDPVAQTFIINKDTFPNGIFLSSISLFFATKSTTDNSPVTLNIMGTQNGYPNSTIVDHSVVVLTPDLVKAPSTQSPHYLDSTYKTVFTFSVPLYLQAGVLYAFTVQSNSNQYTLYTASNGDTAIASTTKNLPTDPTPTNITKISAPPYVGSLFLTQNAQTWTADLNQDLMFVIDRCVFNTGVSPSIPFVTPTKLPRRTIVEDTISYFVNANNISNNITSSANSIPVSAFNFTTTDLVPTNTNINYSYNATLSSGAYAGVTPISPGKYGTATQSDVYLNDGQGIRRLYANSNNALLLYSQLSSSDSAVSPVLSDSGLSTYTITYTINNGELANSNITLVSGGSGYNANTTSVTISSPVGLNATQAYATANIVGGVIQSINFTPSTKGSGYITTPTITITDANTTPGTGASAIITGETSNKGGNATCRYIAKPVILTPGFDSGDLNVYLTAYRPVGTDINVYYKVINRNDTLGFNTVPWQIMTKTNNSSGVYSVSRNDLHEFTFAPGALTSGVDQGFVSYTNSAGQTYTTFNQFAIKIVMTTNDRTLAPFCTDMRTIALPSNVNTTV
jgi:hypothetical protein